MNLDTDGPLTTGPDDRDPPSVTAGIQPGFDRRTCKHPLCTNDATLGSDYCRRHKPDSPPDFNPRVPSPLSGLTSDDPSNRDLQRDLDRIEGKLDALLTALDVEVDE